MTGALLSPFATFLLGIAALLKLVMLLQNPIRRELEKNAGKTQYQIDAEIDKAVRTDYRGVVIEYLGSCQYELLIIVFAFVIDPLVIITAINRNIGFQPLAWVAAFVAAITCYIWARNIYLGIKLDKGGYVDPVEAEHLVPYKWVRLADKIKLSHSIRYWILQTVNYFPDFYLWYLLLVVVGVLP